MTSLHQIICDEIAERGTMRMDRYMALCLMHPEFGYYTTRDPLGRTGDFVTAPEVSQMFGEMIGLWLGQVWSDQGSPDGALLVELGPGKGTLMGDILRVLDKIPGVLDGISIILVEQSQVLQKVQQITLKRHNCIWVRNLREIPQGPLFLVANEFFDALPVRQAERIDAFWLERGVRVENGKLVSGHIPLAEDVSLTLPATARDGEIIEWSEPAQRIAGDIGGRIAQHGGAALVIDYGSDGGSGDTLQAVRDHQFASVLDEPGSADLTAHVNFSRLADAAAPAIAAPLWEQGRFLASLGIGHRAEQLSAHDAQGTANALDRLTGPDQMGTLFKVLGLRPPEAPPLPILEDAC